MSQETQDETTQAGPPFLWMDWLWGVCLSAGLGLVVGWTVWSVVQANKLVDDVLVYAVVGAGVGAVLGVLRGISR